jgi:hypothetical protein
MQQGLFGSARTRNTLSGITQRAAPGVFLPGFP